MKLSSRGHYFTAWCVTSGELMAFFQSIRCHVHAQDYFINLFLDIIRLTFATMRSGTEGLQE